MVLLCGTTEGLEVCTLVYAYILARGGGFTWFTPLSEEGRRYMRELACDK